MNVLWSENLCVCKKEIHEDDLNFKSVPISLGEYIFSKFTFLGELSL